MNAQFVALSAADRRLAYNTKCDTLKTQSGSNA